MDVELYTEGIPTSSFFDNDQKSSPSVEINVEGQASDLAKWLQKKNLSNLYDSVVASGINTPEEFLEMTKEELDSFINDFSLDYVTKKRFINEVQSLQKTSQTDDTAKFVTHENVPTDNSKPPDRHINPTDSPNRRPSADPPVRSVFSPDGLRNLFKCTNSRITCSDIPFLVFGGLVTAFGVILMISATIGQAGVWYYEARVWGTNCGHKVTTFFLVAAVTHIAGIVAFVISTRCCKKKIIWIYLYVILSISCGIVSFVYLTMGEHIWGCSSNLETKSARIGFIVEIVNGVVIVVATAVLKRGYFDSCLAGQKHGMTRLSSESRSER